MPERKLQRLTIKKKLEISRDRENECSIGDRKKTCCNEVSSPTSGVRFGVAVRGIAIKNAAKRLISCTNYCSRGCKMNDSKVR